jgi:hypothetical protein
MPSHDESPAIKTLKKQCREGLDSARQMRSRPIENAQLTEYTIETANEAPIGRARAMQQELRRAGSFKSSVREQLIGQATRLIYFWWQAWALIYASDVTILAWCYHPFPDCNNYRNIKKVFVQWLICHPMYKEASNPLCVFPSFLDHVSNIVQAISCLCSAVMSEQRGVTIILDDAWQSLYNRQSLSSGH